MQPYRQWAVLGLSVAILSACTTLDTQHPDKMYRQAIMNNLQKDNQYNFSANATLSWQDKTDAASTPKPAEVIELAAASEVKSDSQANEAFDEAWQEVLEAVLASADTYPVVTSLMKHSAVKIDGAMDLPQGKFEIIPAMQLGTANYATWAQLPIHVDGKQERILVDVQGYANLVGEAALGEQTTLKQKEAIKHLEDGALLELKAPDSAQERYPIQTIFKAIPKGLEQYLNAMDDKKFALVAMDDYGRGLGATYKVQLDYNTVDSMAWSGAFLEAYSNEFDRLHKEAPEENVNDEAYEAVKSVLMLSAMLFGISDPKSATCQESEEALEKCLQVQSELEKSFANLPNMQHNLYLNRRGRILGVQDEMVLQHPKASKNLRYQSQIKLYNYGRPQFGMAVQSRPKVSIWDFIESHKTTPAIDWED